MDVISLGVPGGQARDAAAAATGAGPLVGRRGEAETLARLAAQLAEGHGGVAVVTGEPGIGKTHLLAVGLACALEAGARGLAVGCLPVGESLPLDPVWSLVRALARLIPTGASHGPAPDASQGAMAGALMSSLEHVAAARPVLVVIDDLHWAATAARDIFHAAAVHLSDLPVAWLLAGRPVPAVSDFARHLARTRNAEIIQLGPLGPHETAELLEFHVGGPVPAGIAAAVQRSTAGNPLLCVTLARAGLPPASVGQVGLAGDGAPVSLDSILADWLGHLDPGVADGLRWACVLPEQPDPQWLAALTAAIPAVGPDLDALAATGLIGPAEGGLWRFRHPLIRQALYQGMPPTERARRHRAVVSVMGGAPAHLLAPQLAGAGLAGAAGRAYLEVGDTIYRRGGGADAAEPYQRSAALAAEASDQSTVRSARAGLALALLRAGQVSRAHELADDLLGELDRAGQRTTRLLFLSRFGLALWDETSDLDGARRLLAQAEDALTDEQPTGSSGDGIGQQVRAEAALAQAVVLDRAGQPTRALRFAQDALAAADALGDQALRLGARNRIGLILGETGSAAEAIAVLKNVASEAAQAGFGAEAALAFLNLSYFCEVSGDVAGFEKYARHGLALPDLPPSTEALLRGNLSFALMNRGDLESALAHQLAARAVAARAGHHTEDRVVVGLAHVHIRTGDLTLAGRLLDSVAFTPGSFEERRTLEALALLLEESDRPAEALACYARVAAAPGHPGAAWCLAGVVRTAVAVGDARAARAAGQELARLEARWPASRWLLTASKGWLAGLDGDTATASGLLTTAASACSETFEAARFRLEAARLCSDGPAILACAEAYDRMGARHAADRARHLARTLGLPAPRRRAQAGRLTRREHEIALLAAAGQRNAEIAALLYLSERTVEHHVSSILTKLGLRSRVELASLAAAGRLPG